MGSKSTGTTDSYIIDKYGIANFTLLFRRAFIKGFRKGYKQGKKSSLKNNPLNHTQLRFKIFSRH